jgi:hypothetical protein
MRASPDDDEDWELPTLERASSSVRSDTQSSSTLQNGQKQGTRYQTVDDLDTKTSGTPEWVKQAVQALLGMACGWLLVVSLPMISGGSSIPTSAAQLQQPTRGGPTPAGVAASTSPPPLLPPPKASQSRPIDRPSPLPTARSAQSAPVALQRPPPLLPLPPPSPRPVSPVLHPPPVTPSMPASLRWVKHATTNCWWSGNGAEKELESPQGSAAPGVTTIPACQDACRAMWPECEGVLFSTGSHCYRKGGITVDKCHSSATLDLYTLEYPPPPSPPSPPPTPPMTPVRKGIRAINERFRKGTPSDNPTGVGLFMHQWDGQEVTGKPWQMCIENCMCQGQFIPGRVSTMIVYAGLSNRPDRTQIPMPFGARGGILLHPSHVKLDCLYGIDAATYQLKNPARPGCSETFCNPNNFMDQNGNAGCGFSGAPATGWAPTDLKGLLEAHALYGEQGGGAGFHSGYNEVIVNSKHHNEHLPHAVEAFFYIQGQSPVTGDLGYSIVIDVVEAHKAFLAEYQLTEDDVPLLLVSRRNTRSERTCVTPFSHANARSTH